MGHTATTIPPHQRAHTEGTAAQRLSDVVAENLRAELARRRMSNRGFAALVGWTKSTTARRVAGEQPLSLNDVEDAARVLGLQVTTLIGAP